MPKTIFLTSSLNITIKNKDGTVIAKPFTKANNLQENFKKFIKKFDNFLFVASIENNDENNDYYFNNTKQSFNLTMPFKNFYLLDGRTINKAKELIEKADFIYLCGGHVPTQNKFFKKINLKTLLKNYNGVICGASAGSMNCASVVYSPPELAGEAVDTKFKRHLNGLNLTNINIFPHFNHVKNVILDGKHTLNDILLPDSFNNEIVAFSDNTYILIQNGNSTIYGTAYLIKNGKITKICKRKKILNEEN